MGPGRSPQTPDFTVGNVYLSTDDLRSYDGDVLRVDILSDRQQPGEIIGLDVWPLMGVGVGLLGARANVGPVGLGLGTLFYRPLPAHRLVTEHVEEDVHVETRSSRTVY